MIIGDGIMLGAGGETASIFVTGLSETDSVSASKDGKTVAGKWVSNPNPAIVVPDGYTQLEYIKATGTQFINTRIAPSSGISVELGMIPDTGAMSENATFGSTWSASGFFLMFYQNNIRFHSKGASVDISAFNTTSENKIVCTQSGISVNGTNYSISGTGTDSSDNIVLWSVSNEGGNASNRGRDSKTYCRIKVGDSVVREYVPCKQNSNGAIGMYDLVTNTFFGNDGTGTFTAGSEVPQTIGGFLIDKIKDYGTWTVTATNGTHTKTQDVLVDSAVQYDISLSYVDARLKIWLNGSGYTDESLVGNAVTNYGTSLVTSNTFPYYAFDGSNHYIQFPSQTIAPNDFAISLWGYFDGNYSWERFFDFGEGVAKDLWCGHSSTTGNLAFEYQVNSTGYTSNRVSFSSGAWHHIALRGNNSTTTMYVDGASVTSVSNPSVGTLSLANCYLGKSNWNDPYLHGRIADFRLYNTAITEAEIIELYQSGAYVPN